MADRLPKSLEVNGFLDIAVSSQIVTGHQIPFLFRGGHNDDWDSLGPGVTLDLFEHLHPIDLGQFQIQQHQFGRATKQSMRKRSAAEEKIERFLPVARYDDIVRQLVPLQRMQSKIHVILIIFYQ